MATSKLLKTTPQTVQSGGNFTASTSRAYTGYSITIPANCYFVAQASLWYIGSSPKDVSINTSSTNANATLASGGNFGSIATAIAIGDTGDTSYTLYLWASYNSAGSNSGNIKAMYWKKTS